MRKGDRKMSEVFAVMDKIIREPIKKYSKEEALSILKEIGILDENDEVVEAYKDFFEKKDTNGSK